MLKEEYLKQLMRAVYDKKMLNLFDLSAEYFSTEDQEFQACIDWANVLVQENWLYIQTNKKQRFN